MHTHGLKTVLNKIVIYNNELDIMMMINKDDEIPIGFIKGRRPLPPKTKETRDKLSSSLKGISKSKEHKEKIAEKLRGKSFGKWIHNPESLERKRIKEDDEIPDGFIFGKCENVTDKLRETRRNNILGRKWFYNPSTGIEILLKPSDVIPEGFIRGRFKTVNKNIDSEGI